MQWGYLEVFRHMRKLIKKPKDHKVCMTCSTNNMEVVTKFSVESIMLQNYRSYVIHVMCMESIFNFIFH